MILSESVVIDTDLRIFGQGTYNYLCSPGYDRSSIASSIASSVANQQTSIFAMIGLATSLLSNYPSGQKAKQNQSTITESRDYENSQVSWVYRFINHERTGFAGAVLGAVVAKVVVRASVHAPTPAPIMKHGDLFGARTPPPCHRIGYTQTEKSAHLRCVRESCRASLGNLGARVAIIGRAARGARSAGPTVRGCLGSGACSGSICWLHEPSTVSM